MSFFLVFIGEGENSREWGRWYTFNDLIWNKFERKTRLCCLTVLNWCKYSATALWNKCWGWKYPHKQDIKNKIYKCSVFDWNRKIYCNKTLRSLMFVHGTPGLPIFELKFKIIRLGTGFLDFHWYLYATQLIFLAV